MSFNLLGSQLFLEQINAVYLYWTRFSIYKHSSLISLPLYSNFIETLKSNTMSYFCCYILSQISLKNWYEVNFMNLRFIFIDENFMIRVDVKLLYLWIKERMTFKNWTNSTVESPPIVLVSTIKLFRFIWIKDVHPKYFENISIFSKIPNYLRSLSNYRNV